MTKILPDSCPLFPQPNPPLPSFGHLYSRTPSRGPSQPAAQMVSVEIDMSDCSNMVSTRGSFIVQDVVAPGGPLPCLPPPPPCTVLLRPPLSHRSQPERRNARRASRVVKGSPLLGRIEMRSRSARCPRARQWCSTSDHPPGARFPPSAHASSQGPVPLARWQWCWPTGKTCLVWGSAARELRTETRGPLAAAGSVLSQKGHSSH